MALINICIYSILLTGCNILFISSVLSYYVAVVDKKHASVPHCEFAGASCFTYNDLAHKS
jgi:hypothetical protein